MQGNARLFARLLAVPTICLALMLGGCGGEDAPEECCDAEGNPVEEPRVEGQWCNPDYQQCNETGDPGDVTTSLSKSFGGKWSGNLRFTSSRPVNPSKPEDGVVDFIYWQLWTVSVSGNSMTMGEFGVINDGSLTATGTGTSVSWTGSAIVSTANGVCPDGHVQYTSGTLSVSNSGFSINLKGKEYWCGSVYDVTLSTHPSPGQRWLY